MTGRVTDDPFGVNEKSTAILYPVATSAPEIPSPTLLSILLSRRDPRIPLVVDFWSGSSGKRNVCLPFAVPACLFHIPPSFVEYAVLLRTRLYIYIRPAYATTDMTFPLHWNAL